MQARSKKSAARSSTAKSDRVETFEAAARRLGCDDDKRRFEERLGKIAKAKSKDGGAKAKRK